LQVHSQAEAFAAFIDAQVAVAPEPTICDSWGCYYSQGGAPWGTDQVSGTTGAQNTMAHIGCLITAVAMTYTHYQHNNVMPRSINALASNFSTSLPGDLLLTVSAEGVTSTRVATTLERIDVHLSVGTPVIVEIVHPTGGTHFVVLVSGSAGSYVMHDPYYGRYTSFTDHYTTAMITNRYVLSVPSS